MTYITDSYFSIGYSHVSQGVPCQDDALSQHNKDNYLLALADGCSSGRHSDIDVSIDAFGEVGSIARYTLTAVGILALLNKHITGITGFAKEFDGTRIYNILSDAFLQSWDELSPTLTWQQVNSIVTWDNWDGTKLLC